jgi:cytochrome c553
MEIEKWWDWRNQGEPAMRCENSAGRWCRRPGLNHQWRMFDADQCRARALVKGMSLQKLPGSLRLPCKETFSSPQPCGSPFRRGRGDAVVAHGKALVEANCARCHGITGWDKSVHPDASAFRTLSKRYPLDALEEAFAEGISTGHPDMPEFVATQKQIEAILAYIGTLDPE